MPVLKHPSTCTPVHSKNHHVHPTTLKNFTVHSTLHASVRRTSRGQAHEANNDHDADGDDDGSGFGGPIVPLPSTAMGKGKGKSAAGPGKGKGNKDGQKGMHAVISDMQNSMAQMASAIAAVAAPGQGALAAPGQGAPGVVAVRGAVGAAAEAFVVPADDPMADDEEYVKVSVQKVVYLKETLERASSATIRVQNEFVQAARSLNAQNAIIVAAAEQMRSFLEASGSAEQILVQRKET